MKLYYSHYLNYECFTVHVHNIVKIVYKTLHEDLVVYLTQSSEGKHFI